MENKEILRVENLKKYFLLRKGLSLNLSSKKEEKGPSYVRAVNGVTFTLHEGEIMGFVGESGCGKSTMSRTLLRLVEPTEGKILLEGTDITALNRQDLKRYRRKMQMIFQDPFGSINPRRTTADTIRQTIRIHKLCSNRSEEDELIKKTLEEVELRPPERFWNKYPNLLSGGQLQRISIGRVIVLQPRLVIADEPISMLDVSVRIGILDLIMKMREKFDISFIYITHDLITARYICDRIAIMYLGEIVEMGPADDVMQHPLHPYTQALVAAVPNPDPTIRPSDIPIKGYIPMSSTQVITSCSFYPRCPYGTEKCREGKPKMLEVDKGYYVSCFKINNR